MKRIIIILFLMFLVLSVFVYGEKVAVIDEVLKPVTLAVDDTQLYITEGASVFIYSLKDYKFIKKFGREGQGPQEFALHPNVPLAVDVSTENLIVNSFLKVSYFTKDGSFIKEVRTKGLGFFLAPLKEGYVGLGQIREDNLVYNTINFYDAELNRGKEIARVKLGKIGGNLEILKRALNYAIHEDTIYVSGKEGFMIDVLDNTGKKLYSITREYKKIKFDPKVEKQIREDWKRRNPPEYEALKNRLEFPDYFPEILSFFIDNNKIYVATWKWEKDKIEFFILDLKGKLLKKQFVTFAFQEGSLSPYPPAIKDGKLYQLIENEEEEWELHISKFD